MHNSINVLEWLGIFAVLVSIMGNFLIIAKKRLGFLVWIVSNMFWIYIDMAKEIPSQAALFLFYTALSIYGFVQWRKEK
jgi:nicotinamide riboside transporter PnuC